MARPESPEHRLKRLHMRSWRRGMKEMDLILGPFADGQLADLTEAELDKYEIILEQNDQELYLWITARISGRRDMQGPPELGLLLDQIAELASNRLQWQAKTVKSVKVERTGNSPK